MKTEPGEAGENKPNLRRRMGSFVAKSEPGQAPGRNVNSSTATLYLKLNYLIWTCSLNQWFTCDSAL